MLDMLKKTLAKNKILWLVLFGFALALLIGGTLTCQDGPDPQEPEPTTQE